ncbi:MAG: sulfurtransferase TusA family protein [Armatimonadetes bacterium]|nr:sulfurtransferase TusA family protein [Armatimonadota bacterium]
MTEIKADASLDCKGLLCPKPMVEMFKKMRGLIPGQILEVLSDDELAKKNIPDWCTKTGNEYLGFTEENKLLRFFVKKRA